MTRAELTPEWEAPRDYSGAPRQRKEELRGFRAAYCGVKRRISDTA